MTAPRFSKWFSKCLAAGLLMVAGPSVLCADEYYDTMDTSIYVDNTDHDLQFFSPVDFDFENQPIQQNPGFFFGYDKLSWAATGERVTIGDPNVNVLSELIYPIPLLGATQGPIPVSQYTIINGVQDAPPHATFAWGERYELGYGDGEVSHSIGILDGPEHNSSETFGNGPQESGFGSVHVNFETPEDFLLGFRDYGGTGIEVNFFVLPTETTNGPGGEGDGIVDDLDGDGAEGFVFFVADINGDGTIDDDEVIGIGVDLDDLHEFNVTFNELNVRNVTETQGVELMKTHHIDNRHLERKHQNQHWEFGYGVRFLRLHDEFRVDGTSPLLGTCFWDTAVENQIVGPQIRAKWSAQRGRWNLGADLRGMFGWNITDIKQRGAVGLETEVNGVVTHPGLIPGGINSLLSGQPTSFAYGKRADEFSPVAEFRAQTSYQITRALAAKLGYTATFVDNISRGSQVTRYYLPDMGLKETGAQYILINGVNFGFDVVY